MFNQNETVFVTFGAHKDRICYIKRIDGEEYILYDINNQFIGRFREQDIEKFDMNNYIGRNQ
jgi:hypothetical protein